MLCTEENILPLYNDINNILYYNPIHGDVVYTKPNGETWLQTPDGTGKSTRLSHNNSKKCYPVTNNTHDKQFLLVTDDHMLYVVQNPVSNILSSVIIPNHDLYDLFMDIVYLSVTDDLQFIVTRGEFTSQRYQHIVCYLTYNLGPTPGWRIQSDKNSIHTGKYALKSAFPYDRDWLFDRYSIMHVEYYENNVQPCIQLYANVRSSEQIQIHKILSVIPFGDNVYLFYQTKKNKYEGGFNILQITSNNSHRILNNENIPSTTILSRGNDFIFYYYSVCNETIVHISRDGTIWHQLKLHTLPNHAVVYGGMDTLSWYVKSVMTHGYSIHSVFITDEMVDVRETDNIHDPDSNVSYSDKSRISKSTEDVVTVTEEHTNGNDEGTCNIDGNYSNVAPTFILQNECGPRCDILTSGEGDGEYNPTNSYTSIENDNEDTYSVFDIRCTVDNTDSSSRNSVINEEDVDDSDAVIECLLDDHAVVSVMTEQNPMTDDDSLVKHTDQHLNQPDGKQSDKIDQTNRDSPWYVNIASIIKYIFIILLCTLLIYIPWKIIAIPLFKCRMYKRKVN